MSIRRTLLGTLGFLMLALLVLAPFKAHADQTWTPLKDKPASHIAIEDAIPADESNEIQSAFERTLNGDEAKRYVYVGRLPETFDLETAARQTADIWKLDRTKDSLLFYDELGQHTFIWPATEENTKVVDSLPTVLNANDFAGQFSKLYAGEDTKSDADHTVTAITSAFKPAMPFFFIMVGAVILIAIISFFSRY